MNKYYFASYSCRRISDSRITLFNGVFEGSLFEHIEYLKENFNKVETTITFYKEISVIEYQKLKDIL